MRQQASNWPAIRVQLRGLVRRLGHLPSSELSPIVWAEHRAARATEPDHRRKLPAPFWLNVELSRAKELLKWGVANRLLEKNPLAEAKAERAISARETWLEAEDVEKLLTAADRVRDRRVVITRGGEWRGKSLRAFILCCVDTGMRKGEAIKLRWDRIGDDGIVELLARQTKSRRRRIVALTPRALEAMRAIPRGGRHVPTGSVNPTLRASDAPWVFLNVETGDRLSDKTMWAWFRQAVAWAGLDAKCAEGDGRLRLHDLRHTHASLADARGASPTSIRDALGHTNLAITERYLHKARTTSALDIARIMTISDGKVA